MSANDIIASNLRRIRVAKGLSQAALAEAAGLSRVAYRQIEAAEVTPRPDSLRRIKEALGVKTRELVLERRRLTAVRFRARKRLTSREDVLVRTSRWLDDYRDVEETVGDRIESPVAALSRAGAEYPAMERPVRLAADVRTHFGIEPNEPIRDISGLLEQHGIKVWATSVASDKFFGLSVAESDGGPAVVVNTWDRISVERWIFTAAHELGHLLMHLGSYSVDATVEDEAEESEADRFAAELLMPDAVFLREWELTSGLQFVVRVLKVKRMFRVSYRTVLHRVARLSGDPRVWQRFAVEHKTATGYSLAGHVEPEGLPPGGFSTTLISEEPERLARCDFREDRLARLVRRALESEEITLSRAAEILDISVSAMLDLSNSWV